MLPVTFVQKRRRVSARTRSAASATLEDGKMHRSFDNASDNVSHTVDGHSESQWAKLAGDLWIPQKVSSTISEVVTYLDGKIAGSGADAADQLVMKDLSKALAKADVSSLSKIVGGLDAKAQERVANAMADTLKGLGVTVRIDKGVKGDSSDDVLEFVEKTGKHKLMIPLDGSAPQGGDSKSVYEKNTPKLDPSDPKWTPGRTNPLADSQEANAGYAAAGIQSRLREEVRKKL